MRNLVFVVVATFLLSACSGLKLVYGLADDLLEREAAFYLDLDESGSTLLDQKVEDVVLWHQSSMLPQYAAFFREQADILEEGEITRQNIDRAFGKTRVLLERTLLGITPHAATVLADHTTAQKIAHIRKQIYERNAERAERHAQPRAERLERRVERLTKNFGRAIGDLTPGQAEVVERYAAATLGDSGIWVDHLHKRQIAFLSFLEQQPNERQIEPFLEKIMLRSYEVVQPEYKSFSEARFKRFQNLLFDILSQITPTQRSEAVSTLRSWANDFTDLSASLPQ